MLLPPAVTARRAKLLSPGRESWVCGFMNASAVEPALSAVEGCGTGFFVRASLLFAQQANPGLPGAAAREPAAQGRRAQTPLRGPTSQPSLAALISP